MGVPVWQAPITKKSIGHDDRFGIQLTGDILVVEVTGFACNTTMHASFVDTPTATTDQLAITLLRLDLITLPTQMLKHELAMCVRHENEERVNVRAVAINNELARRADSGSIERQLFLLAREGLVFCNITKIHSELAGPVSELVAQASDPYLALSNIIRLATESDSPTRELVAFVRADVALEILVQHARWGRSSATRRLGAMADGTRALLARSDWQPEDPLLLDLAPWTLAEIFEQHHHALRAWEAAGRTPADFNHYRSFLPHRTARSHLSSNRVVQHAGQNTTPVRRTFTQPGAIK